MIDVRFEINGRRTDLGGIKDSLERAVCESIVDQIKQRVGAVRDPETGRSPKIIVKGRNLKNLSFEVEGSEAVIEQIKRALA